MNCIIIDDSEFAIELMISYVSKLNDLTLLDSFTDPVKALNFIADKQVDIIFLDIEMPELNGLDFIKILNNNTIQIILTTSHSEHALESYRYNVTDYLVKPFTLSRFTEAVTKSIRIHKKLSIPVTHPNETLYIKKGKSIVKVLMSDILWMESDEDYVSIHTEKERFMLLSSLNSIEKKINSDEFMRIHRSCIIRLDKIQSIEDSCISLGGKLFPIGKTYKTAVYGRLNIL